jgi:hypothetical protein
MSCRDDCICEDSIIVYQIYLPINASCIIDLPLAPRTKPASDATAFGPGTRLACRAICGGFVGGRLHYVASCTTRRILLDYGLDFRLQVRCWAKPSRLVVAAC